MITSRSIALLLAIVSVAPSAFSQRQMEKLGRGIVAVRTGTSSAYVGWRLLGTDAENVGFNVLRSANGATAVQLNGSLITNSCNFTDSTINYAVSNAYLIQPVVSGVTQALSAPFGLAANLPTQQYINIPLSKPADGTNGSGPFTYSPNDCSAADLDGDGEYEIIVKWDPSNSKDNSQSGFTGNVFLDAYKLNGTFMWRIDLGQNIRAGAHYTQFMVYDLDGDGRAEIACKTAPGTRDGLGNYVDGNAAFSVYTNSGGYILSGPEYFTIFNGLNGAKLAHTNYVPGRGTVSDWGDSYGNRVDRFLAGIAYLDGVRPSVVMCRGYYTRTTLAAWDWRNGVLTQRWLFDTGHSGGPYSAYKEQGNHQLSVADVDADGRDEIVYGACTIDDDGTGLYTTGLRHGDALHVTDMDPFRPGYERWGIHETTSTPGSALTATATGEVLWLTPNADVGRGVAADLNSTFPGVEMWGGTSGLRSVDNQSAGSSPSSSNFAVWWDSDLLRELEDGTSITKYGGGTLLSPSGLASNNSTKSTPNLSADLFGDWREEVIWRTSGNTNLYIYTTTTVATNRLVTLMHDPMYRVAIAWQNTAYNQPPHPGFYIGPQMYPAPLTPTSTAQLAWRGGNGGNVWDAAGNWFINGIWTNNITTNYTTGNSVLFDLRASNNTSITLSGTISPASVTVFSASNITFTGSGALSGSGKLIKAGPGKLFIANTNHYSGNTVVSGGQLIVNGALTASPIILESRGEPWGRARISGVGKLGQGLTVQKDCGIIVGAGTNSPGTFTITNGLTELGGAVNQFDLSNDPSGVTKTNDRINVIGNLTLTGTNIIEITQLDGGLGGGVYPLITYTGTLSGGLNNLTLAGSFIQTVALTNPPGMIALVAAIPASVPNAPSSLTATEAGAYQINLSWTDNSSDENAFFIERATGSPSGFAQIAQNPANDTSYVDATVSPSTTYYYRVYATNLAGLSPFSNTNSATTTPPPASLVWRGDGSGNVWDAGGAFNWSDGANLVVFNNGALALFDQSGSNNSPVILSGSLQPASVTVNASKNYTLSGNGNLAGGMALTKTNSGTFTVNTTNTFTGGVNLNAGTVSLGNNAAAGIGAIRFNGGTLTFSGSGQPTYANALTVNSNGTINSAGENNNIVSGAWTGSSAATLNINIPSGTFTIGGNITGYPGKVALGSSSGTFRFHGSSGSPNTSFDLGTGTSTLNNRNGITVTLGALSGGSGTFLSGAGSVNAPSFYIVGEKNLSTTFAGTIRDASSARTTTITKTGTAVWTLTGSNTYSGTTTVSAGTLLVNGSHSAATNTVTVAIVGTLGGTGIIGGNTTINGELAPGVTIGTLTFNGNLQLNSTATVSMDISKNPLANDQVIVAGTLTHGGTLDVVNTSIETFEAGDNFQLFDAADQVGVFNTITLPALESGLIWNTAQLSTNGHIWVVSTAPPIITQSTTDGVNFALSGTSGTPNWSYDVISSTNIALPFSQWTSIAVGQFDASGNFNVSVPLNPSEPRRFYALRPL